MTAWHHYPLLILAAVFAPAILLTSSAPAATDVVCTKYASPSASDTNAGTLTAPFKSAQYLAGQLAAGETGCLLSGTYVGNVAVATPDTVLASAPGNRAKLVGYVWVKNTADGVTLQDFDVDGHDVANVTMQVHGDNVTLRGLDVTNRNKVGLSYNGICVLAGSGFETTPANTAYNLSIESSSIHNCGDDAHEHSIYLESTRNAHVVDSYLFANPGYGVHMYPDAQGSVIEYNVIDGNSSASKANLTFSGESAGGEYSQPHGSDDNIVRYNLITNAVTRYNVESYFPPGSIKPLNNQVVYNCVWNAPWGNYGYTDGYRQANNKDVDPLYVDRANGNFTLQSGSPCAGWGPRTTTVSDLAPAPAPAPTPAPDFSLTASPTSQSVARGSSTAYGLVLTPTGGFIGPADLSVRGLPAGATASFSTPALTSSSVLTVNTTSTTSRGTYSLTVTAVSGSTSHSVSLTLRVRRK